MRMKKILSLMLAVSMICSSAAVTPTAALADAAADGIVKEAVADSGASAEESVDKADASDSDNSDVSDNGNASDQNDSAADAGNTSGKDSEGSDDGNTSGKDSEVSDDGNTDGASDSDNTSGTTGESSGNDGASDTGDATDPAEGEGESTDPTDTDPDVQSSITVTPEQYQIILAEDGSFTASYTANSGEEGACTVLLEECWLLAEPEAAAGTEAGQETTEENGTAVGDDTITAYSYQILDPAAAADHPDAVLFFFDEKGIGTVNTGSYTGAADIFYEGSETRYYVENGKIRTGIISCVTMDDMMQQIGLDGRIVPYTGYYDGSLYDAGSMLKGQYVLVNEVTENDATTYEYVNPDSHSSYPDAVIYCVDSEGKATLYTKTAVINLTYGGKTYTYYATDGKLLDLAKGKAYKQNGYLYYVAANSKAAIYSGVYKNYFYVKGKVKTASAAYYGFYKNYIYKVDKTGKAVKFTKKGVTASYYAVVYQTNGKKYLCYANPKTAAAKIVIADKNKTTNYQKVVGSYVYNVAYNTGAVSTFTGVYKGKYYSGGKLFTAKVSVYRVYNGYAYSVSKDGAAKVYVRNKSKSGVYCLYAGGKYYMVYYKNGKVKGEATEAQVAAVSKVATTAPNSTTFTASTSAARAKVVNTALSFLGTTENTPAHDEILELYNLHKPLARSLVMTSTYAWCACFVSAMFIKAGYADKAAIECSCAAQVDMWKKMGCWIENDAYVPKTGDIIYYHWNCRTKGDCKTWPNHVGIVVAVSGKTITVIEGNTSGRTVKGKYIGQVDFRNITVNNQQIRGYASPKY